MDPQSAFRQLDRDLVSEKWQENYDALNNLRSIMRHHPNEMVSPQLNKILKHSESLRSGLVKLSLRTLTEYLNTYDLTEKEVMDAQKVMLRKVADTNDFIRSAAQEGLHATSL